MLQKSLGKQTLGVALLLLSGCDVMRNAAYDFNRLTNASLTSRSSAASSPARVEARRGTTAKAPSEIASRDVASAGSEPAAATASPAIDIIGKSEGELRAMFGPPTREENRAPGKTWRYQDGQCTVDVQLYPDVQTRKFGTLAYEVKSDDNSVEGKRQCLGQFRSRAQGRRG